ncbi:GNAT family N-acetyltransferase [Streptomyces beijiangensis]|uniref:GNAT family N-acetyltransferase n=2 Tax=Streptomyces beijiangensis TaxID=163361 RepID=A0A939JCY4_9ACTN|nr:GNAT family N-acetyltransferase [Streptomyces beijiangensis]MBO0511471.1 GNAT family N-acetyltransferase [Streptomyces beijiangensis]
MKGITMMNSAAAISVEVRPATQEDHQWLYELHEQAHKALVERAYGPWKQDQQRAFFAPVVNDHEVFIFSDGDREVGAVYLGERDGDVWLELVEILPEFQRQGYGTHVVRWVVQRASEQGTGTLLQVHRLNEDAHRLYVSEGFSPAGENETHHLMRKSVQS